MRLTFIGTGYVGLVSAVGFASKGFSVCCVDIDAKRVDAVNRGVSPIYEKDLSTFLSASLSSSSLFATTSIEEGLAFSDIIFIAVGTPSKTDGSVNMDHVNTVVQSILKSLKKNIIIINKSTVPVGTANRMNQTIQNYLSLNHLNYSVDIISNPEFLREGEALHDFLYPDRIIIGGKNPIAMDKVSSLYLSFVKDHTQILFMDNLSAEMTKYAANAMLASRISFINEISRLCDKTGANIDEVSKGIGSDHRIGNLFLKSGIGYGGSCFPKDIDAILNLSQDVDENIPLIQGIKDSNLLQRVYFIQKIIDIMGDLTGKNIAVWGLSFKANTDDVRESPAISIIKTLTSKYDAFFHIYDSEALVSAKESLKNYDNIFYYSGMYETLNNQDLLLIMTESKEFLSLNLDEVKIRMASYNIFDGRNFLDSKTIKQAGINYYSIGRQ